MSKAYLVAYWEPDKGPVEGRNRRVHPTVMILFSTIHGSRLYGTATEHSDFDYYAVGLNVKTRQRIEGNQDTTIVELGDFINQVGKGVPQALEALYSPYKVWGGWAGVAGGNAGGWRPYLERLRPGGSTAWHTYRRTIAAFEAAGKPWHAARLEYNLWEMGQGGGLGRFNPRLPPLVAQLIREGKQRYLAEKNFRSLGEN